ncbi:MAG: hypothetical protein QW474_02995 [Candidatus Aenigmatarchaeota archaeon]
MKIKLLEMEGEPILKKKNILEKCRFCYDGKLYTLEDYIICMDKLNCVVDIDTEEALKELKEKGFLICPICLGLGYVNIWYYQF